MYQLKDMYFFLEKGQYPNSLVPQNTCPLLPLAKVTKLSVHKVSGKFCTHQYIPEHTSDVQTYSHFISNQTQSWACSIWFSSVGVQPEPVSAPCSALSGKPNSSCRCSSIHSASLVGNQHRDRFAVLSMPFWSGYLCI